MRVAFWKPDKPEAMVMRDDESHCVAVELSKEDRLNIESMSPDATVYSSFPDGADREVVAGALRLLSSYGAGDIVATAGQMSREGSAADGQPAGNNPLEHEPDAGRLATEVCWVLREWYPRRFGDIVNEAKRRLAGEAQL